MTDQRGAVFLCFFPPLFLFPFLFSVLISGSVCIMHGQVGPDAAVSSRGCTEQGMWPALSVAPCPILLQPTVRVLRVLLSRLFASYSSTALADHLFLYPVVSRYLKLYGNRLQSWTLCSHSKVLFKQFSCLAFPLILSVKNFFSSVAFNKKVCMIS